MKIVTQTGLGVLLVSLAASCGLAGSQGGDAAGGLGSDAVASFEDPTDAADAAAMAALVRRYADARAFMGAVRVSRRGVVLIDRAYGFANAEWHVPSTPQTKFRIGSISKEFTAAAILLLEEGGMLRVEDLLSKYLPDLPAAWSTITLHHLLSHSSGIPDLVAFPEYPALRTQPSPPEKTYLLLRDKPLTFAPGEKFQYSNSGYVVLALVVERLIGKPFHEFLQERILGPLGLADTGGDAPRPLLERRAAGYVPLGPDGKDAVIPPGTPPAPVALRNADFIDMSLPTGGGSLYSTTGDLARWLEGLFGGRLLGPASLAKMTAANPGNYGYGFFVGPYNGQRQFGHGGSIHGFLASLNYYPDAGVIVAVLANLTAGQWVSEIAAGLNDLAVGKGPAPGDASDARDGAQD